MVPIMDDRIWFDKAAHARFMEWKKDNNWLLLRCDSVRDTKNISYVLSWIEDWLTPSGSIVKIRKEA
jgi:hypothetical protein